MRKEVNKLDNLTTGKAVDALLNFETVALFNNQVPAWATSPECYPQALTYEPPSLRPYALSLLNVR